jgi:IS1 family transposase
MSAEFKPRKATFTVTGKGKERVFTAVNKRAHTVAKKLGKRTKVTAAELKTVVGKGTYKFYQYNDEGAVKPIRL